MHRMTSKEKQIATLKRGLYKIMDRWKDDKEIHGAAQGILAEVARIKARAKRKSDADKERGVHEI